MTPHHVARRDTVVSMQVRGGGIVKEPLSRRIFSTQLTPRSCAHLSRSGSGGARIRVSWSSARRYTISATDPTKKARCPYDTGLSEFSGNLRPGVTNVMDSTRADSPYDRRTVLSLSSVVWYLAETLNFSFLSKDALILLSFHGLSSAIRNFSRPAFTAAVAAAGNRPGAACNRLPVHYPLTHAHTGAPPRTRRRRPDCRLRSRQQRIIQQEVATRA